MPLLFLFTLASFGCSFATVNERLFDLGFWHCLPHQGGQDGNFCNSLWRTVFRLLTLASSALLSSVLLNVNFRVVMGELFGLCSLLGMV